MPVFLLSQQPGSASNPFTSIGQAAGITSPNIYFFNLGDTAFSTFVNGSGELLVAKSFGNSLGYHAGTKALTGNSSGILAAGVLKMFSNIATVHITSGGVTDTIDLITSDDTLIQRVQHNKTLNHGADDALYNGAWAGSGSMNAYCSSNKPLSLDSCIVHTCGNGNGLAWIPVDNSAAAKFFSGNVPNAGYLALWVKGTYSAPPVSSDTWIESGNNIYNGNTGIVLLGSMVNPAPIDTSIRLAVKGTIYARKLKISQAGWADYVFDPSYKLPGLQEVEMFIHRNRHLRDLPSAKQIADSGLDIGNSQALILKKVEELTLYAIEQHRRQHAQLLLFKQQSILVNELRRQVQLLMIKNARRKKDEL